MSDESDGKEGICVEYDPNSHVLRILLIYPDGLSRTIEMEREMAMRLYRALGEMLAPDYDG